ncbi:hypothetical protein BY996DRAFT_6420863 [Phakopsora pachyrhizi]|nr:hypothetical protein BY996DRAFT_6420863 [Phakopsora pachyrhizi]
MKPLTQRLYIIALRLRLPGNGSDSIRILPNPLILINSGVVVAVCQLISSVLYEIFLILTLSSFQWQDSTTQTPFRAWLSEKTQRTAIIKFIGMIFLRGAALVLFEFYAFWAIAWTSIYTRLYTEDSYFKKVQRWPYKIFQPLTMNFFFISISILATVLAPIHIYYLAKGFVDNGDHYAAALNSFDSGSIVWEMFNSSINANNSNIWDVNVNALQRLSGALSNSSEKSFTLIVASIDLINKERVITYFWLFFIFAALLLYAIGTQKLLCSINSELSGKKVEIKVVSNRGDTSSSFTNHSVRKLEDQVALRKSRYYLTCYSTLFIIAGLFDMAMRIFQIAKAQEISGQRRWSIIRGWLVLFNGAFIAIAVTFQCWRTFVDFDIIIPINGPNASREEQEPLSPLK